MMPRAWLLSLAVLVGCGPVSSPDAGVDAGFDAGVDAGDEWDGGVELCWVSTSANCGWFFSDGGLASGLCGSMRLQSTCACARASDGGFQPLCTGGCPPGPDGGMSYTRCGPAPFNCGALECSSGTSCVAQNHCG